MFARAASLASVVALAAILAAPALAACDNDERPPAPSGMKAAPKNGAASSAIFFSWRWEFTKKVERVCWDIEVTDGAGKIVQSGAGVGPCAAAWNRFTVPFTVDNLSPGTKRCMRVRARSEPGTKGCVSLGWTAVACATTVAAPAAPKGGQFAALAANGKGFWGYAVGQGSEAQARDAALKGCGQADCKIAISGQNRCIAYYESRSGGYWYGLALGGTAAQVNRIARSGCTKGAPAGTCRLIKSLCS